MNVAILLVDEFDPAGLLVEAQQKCQECDKLLPDTVEIHPDFTYTDQEGVTWADPGFCFCGSECETRFLAATVEVDNPGFDAILGSVDPALLAYFGDSEEPERVGGE